MFYVNKKQRLRGVIKDAYCIKRFLIRGFEARLGSFAYFCLQKYELSLVLLRKERTR